MNQGASSKIISHVRWTYLSVVASGLLQMMMLGIMARLLRPSDFGAIALAQLVLRSGQTLVQSGYERAVIWSNDLTPRLVSGLFWISLATGLVLTGLFAALAYPISTFFKDGQIGLCLRALAPMLMIGAFALVPRGIMRRTYRFGSLGLIDTLSYFVGFVCIGLPMAYTGFGVWSLIAANLVQVALQSGLIASVCRPHVRHSFSLSEVIAPLKFGYSASGLGLLEFLDIQLASIFIGRLQGVDALGLYNRAYALIQLPLEQLGTSLTRVLYSSFNEAKSDIEQVSFIALRSTRYLTLLIIPPAIGGAVASHTVIVTLLGARWSAAAPIFSILAISTASAVTANLLATLNEALYLIKHKTVLQLGCTGTQAVLLVLLAPHGLAMAAVCVCISRLMFFAGQFFIAFRHLGLRPVRAVEALLPGLITTMIVALGTWQAESTATQFAFNTLDTLIFDIAIAGVLYVGAILVVAPELRQRLGDLFCQRLSRKSQEG